MAFTRLLRNLARDEKFGARVVPIIPDEARTFGMDALFREFKIYASHGQKYDPVDAELLLSYAESKDGQILEEGITEAGSMASFTAAGTAYATRGVPMVPFFMFYSMFGFQRVGDLIWAAADARARGFLLGATAGRTTLLGEGLQHQDGHSLLLASTIPSCEAYDPAFAYEMAAIIRHGIDRMYGPDALSPGNAVFYYLTFYNENYVQPAMPDDDGVDDGIIRGLYKWADAPTGPKRRATILFSGSAQGAARQAQADLAEHFDVAAELWSATSYKKLREEALSVERWNRLHPAEQATHSVRHDAARRNRGTDRGRHRLPQGGARPDRELRARGPLVHHARYRRVRPQRHARCTPAFLRDRRRPRRGRRARRASRTARRRLSDLVAKAIAHYQIDADAPDPRDS